MLNNGFLAKLALVDFDFPDVRRVVPAERLEQGEQVLGPNRVPVELLHSDALSAHFFCWLLIDLLLAIVLEGPDSADVVTVASAVDIVIGTFYFF